MRKLVLLAVMLLIGSGTTAIAADFNGDGTNDIGIFRSSSGLWAIRGVTRVYFGSSGDKPMPGDYNGDGVVDIALFRPSAGLWAVRGITRLYFGGSSDEPIAGIPSTGAGGSGYWNKSGVDNIIYGGNIIVQGSGGFNSLGDLGIVYIGDTYNYIKVAWGYGMTFGTYGAGDTLTIDNGNVGIGTTNPQSKLDVRGGAIRQTLPRTGQTSTYHTGDDGNLQKGLNVLHDNGDGTVTDTRTGLMWPKDGTGKGYNYRSTKTWALALDWANSLDFANYTDWRIPNINELKSFQEITWGHYQSQPTDNYWSSTYMAGSSWNGLVVDFATGNVAGSTMTTGYYVVAVRGGQ